MVEESTVKFLFHFIFCTFSFFCFVLILFLVILFLFLIVINLMMPIFVRKYGCKFMKGVLVFKFRGCSGLFHTLMFPYFW
jgi:hypothetical protein